MKKAVGNILKIISYPLLYLGLQFFISFIYMLAVGIFAGIKIGIESVISGGDIPSESDIMETVMPQINVSVPLMVSGAASFIIIFAVMKKEWKAELFWSLHKIKAPLTVLCAALGIALNCFTVGVLTLLPIPEQQQAVDIILGENLILQFLSLALIGPVLEEIIFRGIVLKRLSKMMKLPAAVILQALIFGVIHFNITQGIYAFFLGIIIGVIYIWFDSIWAAIAVHVFFNATSVMISYIAGDAETDAFVFLIMAAAAFVVSTGIMFLLAGKKTVKTGEAVYNRWAY